MLPPALITVSSRVQIPGAPRVIQGGGSGQYPSAEERETVRNEIYQIVVSAIASTFTIPGTYFCNGSPGWRRVAFINMTDTSYCPSYWIQFDIIFQEDMWTITYNSRRMFFNHIQCWRFIILPGVWEDEGIPVRDN